MSQEFYSSASSDDQSSINSVVHVGDVCDSTTDGEEGEGDRAGCHAETAGATTDSGTEDDHFDEPERENINNIKLPKARPSAHQDSSSDSDEDDIIREEHGEESDSSSSSEGTQV